MEKVENILDDPTLKRGIHLGGKSKKNSEPEETSWWEKGRHYYFMLVFISLLMVINVSLVFPLFLQNISPSYTSAALLALAGFFESIHLMPEPNFFLLLTITALTFAPISFYFFVRRNVFNNDLTAFLATLLYILPNPLFKDNLPLASAVLGADGAHAFVFAFIPLLLLSAQEFLATGLSAYGVLTAIGTALVAIISPFGAFNLVLFYGIITLADGFLGRLKNSIMRMAFILVSSFALSFFWYFPYTISKVMSLSHVSFTLRKSTSFLPILIPAIPILGTILFIFLDRNKKIRPLFMGGAILIIYSVLYFLSQNAKVAGLFTPERYILEISFSMAFFLAVCLTPLGEKVYSKYFAHIKGNFIIPVAALAVVLVISFFGNFMFSDVKAAQHVIYSSSVISQTGSGIGSIGRIITADRDRAIILSSATSILTLIGFLMLILKYPYILGSTVEAKK